MEVAKVVQAVIDAAEALADQPLPLEFFIPHTELRLAIVRLWQDEARAKGDTASAAHFDAVVNGMERAIEGAKGRTQ